MMANSRGLQDWSFFRPGQCQPWEPRCVVRRHELLILIALFSLCSRVLEPIEHNKMTVAATIKMEGTRSDVSLYRILPTYGAKPRCINTL